MQNFGWIIALTGLYFLLILTLVFISRVQKTKKILPGLSEFFLAGKNLHPVVLVGTYVSSLLSTFVVIGLPGLVYTHGIGGVIFLLVNFAVSLSFLYFIGKRFRRFADGQSIFSPLEIISQSYQSKKLGLFIAVIFSVFLIPYISLQLVGVGAFIEAYTQGRITYVTGVGSMMVIVFLYLLLGGMRAVAYTDLIQLVSMMVGLGIGAIYLSNHYDISLPGLWHHASQDIPDHLSLPGGEGFYTYSMLISSSLVLVGLFVQPHLLTRTIMARHDREITYMVIGTLIGCLLVSFFALFYGFFAQFAYGNELAPNLMVGYVFKTMASFGFWGMILSSFMLMGALGAAMSTSDSLLIAIGQICTRDIARPFMHISREAQVLLSQGIMFVVLLGAFLIGLNPPTFMTDLALYSAAGCVILIPTFLCFEWQKRSVLAAYVSIIVGLSILGILIGYKMIAGKLLFEVNLGFIPLLTSFVLYFGLCLLTTDKFSEKNGLDNMQANK